MSYTAYELLEGATIDDLNLSIAAAIAAGQQPVGPPVASRIPKRGYAQAMAVGPEGWQVQTAVITVTAAEILALHTTAKTLITAPGAGIAIIPLSASLFLDYATAAYAAIAAGDDLELRYTNGAGGLLGTIETTGFLDQTADQHREYIASGTVTPTANAPLVLALIGAITTGDSPLKIVVRYRLLTLLT